jgi:transitional endoplasmic reticulum ATPase
MAGEGSLCPAQMETYKMLQHSLQAGDIVVVYGETGRGKTTVLQYAHQQLHGAFLTMADYVAALRDRDPLAMEETFELLIREAIDATESLVFLDDLHLVANVTCGCTGFSTYPRPKFLDAPLTTLCAYAAATGKKLIFGSVGSAPGPIAERCYYAGIDKFTLEDYRFLCHAYLEPEIADHLDYAKIYRFAPKLNGHQLKGACLWLRNSSHVDTEHLIQYLRARKMASNVDLGEVQAVDLHELKGLDDLLQSLEANIILPLENDALAAELDIRPKRGVLLAGPPGTGKTTVGRALAHRLRSKFFLIDGTFISGTRQFYDRVNRVFEAAKENAPSIIFIDDSDVIFQNNEEKGLYRYLLTQGHSVFVAGE